MIIYFGDLHCQEKQPHQDACLQFLAWLYENYGDETVISGGDIFNQSSHNHLLVDSVIQMLVKFKDFRIIQGNHDYSKRQNSILKPLRHHKNITIYDDITEFELEGISFITLPSNHQKEKQYEDISKTYDYSLSHFTPIQEAFGSEGIELKFKTNVAHIFAHIHRHREFIDNFGNKILVAGSVVSTRNGESEREKNIYILGKKSYEKVVVPQTFEYETIEYPELPTNKNNILNIKNAPSYEVVYDTYKGYNIRHEGIQLFMTESAVDDEQYSFESGNLIEKFMLYAKERSLEKEYVDMCLKYLIEFSGQ